jgi:hypothetical protein
LASRKTCQATARFGATAATFGATAATFGATTAPFAATTATFGAVIAARDRRETVETAVANGATN